MKRILFLSLAFSLFLGCCHIIDEDNQTNDCIISFDFQGEITTIDEPLTKIIGDNDLIFVQVYRGNSRDNSFAYGYFDNTNFKLNLKKGDDSYSLKTFLIKNGKTLLTDLDYYIDTNNGWLAPWHIYDPFCANNLYLNSFTYTYGGEELKYVDKVYLGKMNPSKYFTCDDWLYGEANGFIAQTSNDIWNVELKRMGFKLKYEISGITDGTVQVKIKNSEKTFFEDEISNSSYESPTSFFVFYDAHSVWQYAEDYVENLTVSVVWNRGIGITQDLGSTTVMVKRNCINNIKIRLGSDDQSAGVSLSTEPESSIGATTITIPVE